ncbi:MAG: hypothetical protein NWF00_08340 [Candidatus Bathyarchaeota archaeon]|nr:hypothetical protein [Candidatus Bathyarchaeota archaeon]
MVQRTLMYGIAIVLVIVIVGGYVGYTLVNQPAQPAATPSPSPSATPAASETPSSPPLNEVPMSEEESTQQQVRDETMTYIESNHPETAQYMQSLNWTGGRETPEGRVGAETYVYTTLISAPGAAGWTVTLSYPVVPNPIYTIRVNYTQTGVQNPAVISWNGTWQDGTITETSYISNINEAVAPTQEHVRDDVMSYIQAVHVETDQFMQDLQWTGGKVDTELLGAEQYVYTSENGMLGGAWWTVEIHNPVVPNPTYTVTANYTQTGVQTPYNVFWNGTNQDGCITETGYSSNVPVTQEQIRDSVMNYIKINYNETAQFIQDLEWTGGRVETGLVGAEHYNYTTLLPIPGGAGWTVTFEYPVVLDPVYTITANYTQTGVQNPYNVVWDGTWQSGTITETNYSFSQ